MLCTLLLGWQDPQFLYSRDLTPLYPTGLFPTAFFLWKQFLVLIPETGYINDERRLSSMIRYGDKKCSICPSVLAIMII